MIVKRRILVVEDIESTRLAYKKVLESDGLEVHEAPDLQTATHLLQNIAYHVVCIDLGLDAADGSNYDGRKIISMLPEIEKGSRAIVVSQQVSGRAFEIAIEGFEKHKLARYIRKNDLTRESFLKAVREEANRAELGIYDHYGRAIDVLFHGLEEQIVVDRSLRLLQPRGGYPALADLVDRLLRNLLPVRPCKAVEQRITIVDDESRIESLLWSKAIGHAFIISIGRAGSAEEPEDSVLARDAVGGLSGKVTRADNERSEFLP